MKREEGMAKTYLDHQGYQDIVFEPDGNVPPDLLLNGNIAVEVRRFNQHFKTGGKMEPLENLYYNLVPKIITILGEYKHIQVPHSVFVFIDFERPLRASKTLFDEVRSTLNAYLNDFGQRKDLKVNDKLTLKFFPASKRHESAYLLGGSGDRDSGGLVVANVYEHLSFIIAEKEAKVQPFLSKYPTWWLLLIDTIGYGLDQHDFGELNENPPFKTLFDKVFLVSPNNPIHGSEVQIEKITY